MNCGAYIHSPFCVPVFRAKIESQRMGSRLEGAQIELWRVAYDAPHIHSPLCALGSEDVD